MAFYPPNWRKVSAVIRHLANGRCEWCGQQSTMLSVHHIGTSLATGDGFRPGSPRDKHDLRRENLVAICEACHDFIEPCRVRIREQRFRQRCERRAKRAQHRRLGIGVGLMVIERQVA